MLAYQPSDGSGPQPGTLRHPEITTGEDEALLCRICQHPITSTRNRSEFDGAHEHTFRNPAGYVYDIGIFRDAPGCQCDGQTTFEATWFLGWAWTRVNCTRCGEHLGWRYTRDEQFFFGLILRALAQLN